MQLQTIQEGSATPVTSIYFDPSETLLNNLITTDLRLTIVRNNCASRTHHMVIIVEAFVLSLLVSLRGKKGNRSPKTQAGI